MNDSNESEPTIPARRERDVLRSVESLFRHCDKADNPVLAYSRACSKVGYLARDGVRSELHYLESALNERKHALLTDRYGQPEKTKEHHCDCGQYLRSFQRAVRAELEHPRPPLSTSKLRERIDDNLAAGQWARAGRDLDDLMRRPDIGKPLPALDTYERAGSLDERQFATLQGRIEQCNVNALQSGIPPLSTSALRQRIDRNLCEGHWARARADLDELLRRPERGGPFPRLNEYPRALTLDRERQDELQDRIERCNSLERARTSRNTSSEHTMNDGAQLKVAPPPRMALGRLEPHPDSVGRRQPERALPPAGTIQNSASLRSVARDVGPQHLESDLAERRRDLMTPRSQHRAEMSRVEAEPSPTQTVAARRHRGLGR